MHKWNPSEYKSNYFYQRKWGLELLSKLKFSGDERVLDIGCGNGELTFLISREVPRGFVVGIDNSRNMIEIAKGNFPVDNYPNLVFIEKDVLKLDYESEFDIVFSSFYLHWMIDQLSVLKVICRCLKPEGKLMLQMYEKIMPINWLTQ